MIFGLQAKKGWLKKQALFVRNYVAVERIFANDTVGILFRVRYWFICICRKANETLIIFGVSRRQPVKYSANINPGTAFHCRDPVSPKRDVQLAFQAFSGTAREMRSFGCQDDVSLSGK